MSRLCFKMGNWHCRLFLWKKSKISTKVGQEQIRRNIDSRLRKHKGLRPWCKTWTHRTTTNIAQSQRNVAESSSRNAWWTQLHPGKMAPRFFVSNNRATWVLKLNCEGVQGPINQGPDFAEATREFKRLNDECVRETSEEGTHIPLQQRTKQRQDQQFERLEEYNYHVDPRTGWSTYPLKSQKSHATSGIFSFVFVSSSMGPSR